MVSLIRALLLIMSSQGREEICLLFFSMALILSCGLHLHDLISSQGPNDKHYHTRIRASTCELEEDIHIFSKEDVKKDHLWVSNVLRMPLRCRMYSELEPTGKN